MKLGEFFRREVVDVALNRDVDSAIAEQLARIEQNPGEAQPYCALGVFFRMQGKIGDAILMQQRATELDPSFALPHRELGQIYAVREDHEAAWRHAREAARLGDRSLLELLERYQKASRPVPSGER